MQAKGSQHARLNAAGAFGLHAGMPSNLVIVVMPLVVIVTVIVVTRLAPIGKDRDPHSHPSEIKAAAIKQLTQQPPAQVEHPKAYHNTQHTVHPPQLLLPDEQQQ